MAKTGKGSFLVYVDIDAKHDKEFNDWHNTEHRLRVRRYRHPRKWEWEEQNLHSSSRSPRMRQAITHAPGSPGVYTRIDL